MTDAARGLRFDPQRWLLDPYARAVIVPDAYDRSAATHAVRLGAQS
jgi:hypothetical protein